MSDVANVIDDLRAQREALATGPSKLSAADRKTAIRELSARIRELEGPPESFTRKRNTPTGFSVKAP